MTATKIGPANFVQQEVDPPSTGRSLSLEVLTVKGLNAEHYLEEILLQYVGRTNYHRVVGAEVPYTGRFIAVLTYASTPRPDSTWKDGGQISRRIKRIANTYPWLEFSLRPYWND